MSLSVSSQDYPTTDSIDYPFEDPSITYGLAFDHPRGHCSLPDSPCTPEIVFDGLVIDVTRYLDEMMKRLYAIGMSVSYNYRSDCGDGSTIGCRSKSDILKLAECLDREDQAVDQLIASSDDGSFSVEFTTYDIESVLMWLDSSRCD